MKDSIKVTGNFKLKIFKNNILIEKYEDKNTVVNLGKETMSLMLGNQGVNKHITQIAVGTGNSIPTTSDTTLIDQFIKSIDSIEYPDATSIKFLFEITTLEANQKSIREFGLLSNDGTLFARKTRDVIEKDADISISGEWTINFV